ncbi:MAG: ImmA/IrrE family metallo-endopeptidase [Anaerolineae bacterium]|nr:ImmA/IrrE family metallo-endopeptidase [Anaerolineae bacterium]
MRRFEALLDRAGIDVVDLPPQVEEVKGVMVYLGQFPDGCGRIFLNPTLTADDDPHSVAVVAHELAHFLLSTLTDHPRHVLPLLLDPAQRPGYNELEEEADCLAAYLLVPPDVRTHYPSRYPTMESLAAALGVPIWVVERALAHPDYDPTPICAFLSDLIGHPTFVPRDEGLAG